MTRRILILSFPDDFHALAIQKLLEKHGAAADILDTSAFPAAYSLTHSGSDFLDIQLGSYRLSDYHAIWNRRSHPPKIQSDIKNSDEASYAARECAHALWGALYASKIPIYNDPEAERRAGHKPYQLRLAHELGFRIPETLITTSPDAARSFAERHSQVIYKGLGAVTWMMLDTRPLTTEDLDDLWRLRYAPAIFQEYIERGREYRVSLVEQDIFAGEVTVSHHEARYDWRLDDNHDIAAVELPGDVRIKLRLLLRSLNLHSGAVDLRETPDGTLYFLEINPTGQFLFLDIFGGMDIGSRFCKMLLQ